MKDDSLPVISAGRRRPVQLTRTNLVSLGPLKEGENLPWLVQPSVEGVDLLAWAANNLETLERQLQSSGALLFRNFPPLQAAELEQFAALVSPETLEYRERSSPRSRVSGKVYTSTDYPADQSIFLHNENSYSHTWPLKIFFMCLTPAAQGGETPLADCRKVYRRLSADLKERFERKKICYVRNYREGFGLSWQTVFQTTDRAMVETYCKKVGLDFEWKPGNVLRTRKTGRAAYPHPRTGEWTWFNHATFFHISTLPPEIREPMLREFGEEGLPTNSYYGDGSPIEPDTLAELREAYHRETIAFPWLTGDILILDNMLTGHGRRSYSGHRQVVVAMAEPQSEDEFKL